MPRGSLSKKPLVAKVFENFRSNKRASANMIATKCCDQDAEQTLHPWPFGLLSKQPFMAIMFKSFHLFKPKHFAKYDGDRMLRSSCPVHRTIKLTLPALTKYTSLAPGAYTASRTAAPQLKAMTNKPLSSPKGNCITDHAFLS